MKRSINFAALLFLYLAGFWSLRAQSPPLLTSAFAWWTGDNTADELFTGIHGTAVNGAGFSGGLVGSAFNFNGNGQYFSVPDSDWWNLGGGDFTVELWARFNTDISGSDAIFIGHDEGGGQQNKWFFGRYIGYLLFHINSPSIGPIFFPLVNFTPTPLQWYHLAVTRNGNTYTIYVDGIASGTATDSHAIPNPNAPLTIGQAEGIGYMNGQLDEITMYHRALSSDEIRSIFLAGSNGKHNSFYFVAPDVILAQTNAAISFQLQATNGMPPYHWSVSESRLPNGVTLSDSGLLQGTPTETGEFRFGVSITDATNAVASGYVTIRIPIPAIPYPAPSGIVAWWPFDDPPDSTTVEDRIGNNTGAKANGPTNVLGEVGQALHFDGVDQYVSVQNTAVFQFGTNDFSFETWARFDSPGGGSMGEPSHIIIGSSDGPGSVNKWFFALGGGVLEFHINGSLGEAFYSLGSFSPTVGQWYHLAVVRAGNTLTSYLNGTNSGFATNVINIPLTTAPVTIGQSEFIGLFNGAIDEPTVYSRALSSDEIQAIYNASTAGKSANVTINPAYGGTNGTVTVHFNGIGFEQGATAQLVRSGQTNILGSAVAVATNGTTIDTTFDLHGQTPGVCDIVVTNLDGTGFTLPGSFTIQPSSGSQIWVKVVGLNLIRPGHPQTFNIFYGNSGNVDAVGVPLWIDRLPTNATVTLGFPVSAPLPLGSQPIDLSQIPTTFNDGNQLVVPLLLAVVPAGYSGSLGITVTIPQSEPLQIHAWVNAPIFGSPPSESTVNCYLAIMNDLIQQASPSSDCIQTAFTEFQSLLVQLGYHGVTSLPMSIVSILLKSASACGQPILCNTCVDSDFVATPACIGCISLFVYNHFNEFEGDYQNLKECYNAGFDIGDSLLNITSINSFDPNGQVGPQGAGNLNYLSGTGPLGYSITFENDPSATAPAQDVYVTDVLDPYKVNVNSVQLGNIQFGTNTISVPQGVTSFSTIVDLRTNQNVLVAINCNLDPNANSLNWHFSSLDPDTMQTPDDPTVGFLPPDVTPPQGEGSVCFAVLPRNSIATGTIITNSAIITFDYNPPINTIVWTNAFDFSNPTIQVQPLAPFQISSNFLLSWGSADSGSGIDHVSLDISTNNSDYTTFLVTTSVVSTVVTGQVDSAYWFRVTAWDQVGHSNQTYIASDNSLLTTKVHPVTTNYMVWANQYFGAAANDLSQESTLWGLSANPNGIGSINFFKWYYNQSPFTADSHPPIVTLQSGQPYFSMVRRINEPGVLFDVLWTPDLALPWNVLNTPTQAIVVPIDGTFEKVSWPSSLQTTNKGFYRLRLSLDPAL